MEETTTEQSKKPKKQPTPKQRLAAKRIIENLYKEKPEDLGVILKDIGYSQGVSETPSMITNSQGFKLALADLGLHENLITTALVEDIKAKPKNRVQELKLGAELLGMVRREQPEIPQTKNTYNFFFNPEVQAEVKTIEDKIKSMLIKPNVQKD